MKTVISARFRSGPKLYYFDPGALRIESGTDVIVDTAQGIAYATCVEGNREVPDHTVTHSLSPVLRIATEADKRTEERLAEKEKKAFAIAEEKIAAHGLDMDLVSVSCTFDESKMLFFFISEKRVDFRELVRDLASVFHVRIELRQIGVRDEARMLGGVGICGREYCCSSFLSEFLPVSIKMAKTQNLSLNPVKISGTCGRLMCCLKYEEDAYEDAAKRMPKNDSFVLTPDGPGNVVLLDLLHETARVALDDTPGLPKSYHNCELCVLRNGKGSRDGIEIPKERPARYVEPEKPKRESHRFVFAESEAEMGANDLPEPETPPETEGRGEEPQRKKRPNGQRRNNRGYHGGRGYRRSGRGRRDE